MMTYQLIDFVESYESTINSIRELYVAKVSLQINETMRVLTIFMARLLPLGLIAAIYDMHGIDLKNIAEMRAGFLIVLITMAFIVIGLVLFLSRNVGYYLEKLIMNHLTKHLAMSIQKHPAALVRLNVSIAII
jgi:Mg2+ and Co2+ transporter CorA